MTGRNTRFVWSLIAVIGLSGLSVSCGQKGPLYLPDQEKVDELEKKKKELEQKKKDY